ncbi:MAG: hypothetical protein WCT11_00525 [Candidatus Magasanikbacteria bacterium]|jgi:hypothetical protein
MFVIRKGNQLFNALGLLYGEIVIERQSPVLVYTQAHAIRFLLQAVKEQVITKDEADEIARQIGDAGIAADRPKVFEIVASATLEDGFVPSFQFVICKECTFPIAHGYVQHVDADNKSMSGQVRNLIDGLQLAFEMYADGVHVLDCVNVLKQMIEADLPIDEEAAKGRFSSLPADQLARLDEEMSAMTRKINVPGFGDVTVMKILLPSDMTELIALLDLLR